MKTVFVVAILCLSLSTNARAQAPVAPVATPDEKQKIITISPETTFIVDPLDHRGFPDYLEYLNRELNKGGVPTSQNAAAVLLEIIDRDNPELPKNLYYRSQLYQRLQVPMPDPDEASYVTWPAYLQQILASTPGAPDGGLEAPANEFPASTPWTSEDRPLMAKWIESPATRRALSLLEEMTSRPHYALPYIGSEDPANMNILTRTLLPWVSHIRDLGRLLKTQVMYDLGEGRFDDASLHLIQLHQLAYLQSQQMFLIEKLVSFAIDATACEADIVFAQHPGMPVEVLKRHAERLAQLPPLDDLSTAISKAERSIALNAVCLMAQLRLQKAPPNHAEIQEMASELSGGSPLLSRMFSMLIDYDEGLRTLNQYFDGFVQISYLPYWERKAAYEKMHQDYQLDAIESMTITQLIFQSPQERGKTFARQIFRQLTVLEQSTTSQDRSRMKRELVHVIYALELYHRMHGHYPEELSQLLPAQLTAIPRDRFSDQPLSYVMKNGQYKLECAGYRPLLNGNPSPLKSTSTGWNESD